MTILEHRSVRYRAYDPEQLEPEDPVAVCECTRCRQDVYLDECTIDGGMEEMASVCEDCFEDWVIMMNSTRAGRHQLARMMGFEVVRHEA